MRCMTHVRLRSVPVLIHASNIPCMMQYDSKCWPASTDVNVASDRQRLGVVCTPCFSMQCLLYLIRSSIRAVTFSSTCMGKLRGSRSVLVWSPLERLVRASCRNRRCTIVLWTRTAWFPRGRQSRRPHNSKLTGPIAVLLYCVYVGLRVSDH
jgi:hypothetical protein